MEDLHRRLVVTSRAQDRLKAAITGRWPWGLLAPVIALTDRALPFSSRQLTARALVHLLLAPVFSMVSSHVAAHIALVIGALSRRAQTGLSSQLLG